MNNVVLSGRLTKDPQMRSTQTAQGQMAIAGYSIAVDRRVKREGQPDADFFDLTSFGKQAEFVGKYLKKGTKIMVQGQLQNDSYTNKDGQKVYRTQIIVENVEFAESKKDDGQQPPQGGQAPQGGQPQGGYQQAPQGGYQQAPQGGYQQAPQGGYQQAPQGGYQAPQGGYQQPPQDFPPADSFPFI